MFGSSFLFIPFSPGSGASGVPPFRRLGEGGWLFTAEMGDNRFFCLPGIQRIAAGGGRSGRSATGKRWRLKKITSRVKENRCRVKDFKCRLNSVPLPKR